MKKENMEYIIKNILPDDPKELDGYLRDQANMVLAKKALIKKMDPQTDPELIELEAMLLASTVQIGLIDSCHELLKELYGGIHS